MTRSEKSGSRQIATAWVNVRCEKKKKKTKKRREKSEVVWVETW